MKEDFLFISFYFDDGHDLEKKRDVSEKAKAKYLAMVEAEAKADAIKRQASITASSSSDDFSSSSSDKSLTPVSSSKGRTTSPCLSVSEAFFILCFPF